MRTFISILRRGLSSSLSEDNDLSTEVESLQEPGRIINVILGGPAAGGPSHAGRKKYARSINVVEPPKKKLRSSEPITFSNEDMWGVGYPHSDAIVLTVNLGGIEVRRVLVDNGSSCDILSLAAFTKMGIDSTNLKPCIGGLVSFTGHEAPIIVIISLPLTLGTWPRTAVTPQAR